jgi:hypothetical protein
MSTEILDAAKDDLLEVLAEIISSRLITDRPREPHKPSGPDQLAPRRVDLRAQERRQN